MSYLSVVSLSDRSRMDWDIRKTAAECSVCKAPFGEGVEVCSALFDRTTEFERRDYCLACWQAAGRDEVFSFWRTRVPCRDEPRRPVVDKDVVLNFFDRLEGAEEALKRNFRYVLALLLMRKKVLKFTDVERGEGGEVLVLYDKERDRECRVPNPQLTDEEIQSVTEEVGKLLNIEVSDEESG